MVRIILADDHNLVRNGIKAILEKQDIFQIVVEVSNGSDLLKIINDVDADLILMDINMPQLNGITATTMIREKDKLIKIAALSMYSDSSYVKNMFKNGADGYILKSDSPDELIFAIKSIMEGNKYISKDIRDKIFFDYIQNDSYDEKIELTVKEKLVIKYVCDGYSSKEIASLMNYSVKTIEMYRSEIMKKIKAKSISDLVIYGIKEKIITIKDDSEIG